MPPLITLLTDFGLADGYVGAMQGVMYGIAPMARVVDVTHDIGAQDIRGGALVLRSVVPFFPKDSIHVAVVDPGVGTTRAPIVVATASARFVGPDNGLLAPAVEACGGARGIWQIENPAYIAKARSRTFHGRDIFAPAAAHLALGIPSAQLGSAMKSMEPLALPLPQSSAGEIRGEVIHVDRFGNLISNVGESDLSALASSGLSVSIGPVRDVRLVSAYAQGAPGETVAIINSWGLIEIAVRDDNARLRLEAQRGAVVIVTGTANTP